MSPSLPARSTANYQIAIACALCCVGVLIAAWHQLGKLEHSGSSTPSTAENSPCAAWTFSWGDHPIAPRTTDRPHAVPLADRKPQSVTPLENKSAKLDLPLRQTTRSNISQLPNDLTCYIPTGPIPFALLSETKSACLEMANLPQETSDSRTGVTPMRIQQISARSRFGTAKSTRYAGSLLRTSRV